MKVLVISGSPKGKYSVTYQTVRFLEKSFPEDEFEVLHAGARIGALEKDMSPALEMISTAEVLLFCYPVYTFIAPYQLHRFIRLIKESGVDISGKYACQITTSKHFYDTTAHKYIEENCADMSLRYLGGLAADMDDLLSEKGRAEALDFWRLVRYRKENSIYPVYEKAREYAESEYAVADETVEKKDGNEAVIVANLKSGDARLAAMIEDFRRRYPHKSRVVNLNDYPFKGGCLGCFGCASDGNCVYKDGFDNFLRKEIQTASAIVYAFRVEDHSMGERMKLYDDRQFCNGHRTVTAGMPVAYLACGDIASEENLRLVINGRSEVGGNFLAGIATDEKSVGDMIKTLTYALDNKLTQPSGFLGVGGMKIFRDLIWLMRGMMRADHKFYKSHGLYDFPQKKRGTVLKMKIVGSLIANPKIKAKMGNMMNEGMLMPYEKLFKEMDGKK